MRWFRPLFIVILMAASSAAQQTSGRFDVKRMDPTCKPCEDFYQFVNGGWIKDNPVPGAFARWDTFQILAEDNRNLLRAILEDAARSGTSAGPNERLIGSFYASCMDEPRIESRGPAPIADELARIDKINNLRSFQA